LSRPGTAYEFGPYVLEQAQWRLRKGDEVISLPPKALALLILLVEQAGNMVTKEEILTKVWEGTFVEEGNVAFYVAMLRKTLTEPTGTNYIETVRTRGYRFAAPVSVRENIAPSPSPSPPVLEPAAPAAPAVVLASEAEPVRQTRRSSRWQRVAVVVAAGAIGLTWFLLRGAGNTTVRSVVVMPFRAITPGDDQPYLESGIADAIAMRLGGIATLRVPPLAAIRQNEGPFEAGKRLKTDAVLTGAIQRTQDRLLVSAEVFRVTDGARLSAWRFDTTPGEILNVQNQIAERIAVGFTREISNAEHAKLLKRETVSADAYDLFLQAQEKWGRRTPAAVQEAIGLYERAITIDPTFVRAYAGLANCYNLSMSGLLPKVRYPLAKLNAEKALALDPDSAEAHTAVAFLRYKFEWRWKDAESEFQRAIALDPRDTLAHHWYGEFLSLMGRAQDGIDELRRALELDPSSLAIRADLAAAFLRAGRIDDVRATLESGRKIDPNWSSYPLIMAEVLTAEHRDRESAESLWRVFGLTGVPLGDVDELRAAFQKGGRPAMIRAQIQQYLRLHPETDTPATYFVATRLSIAYGELGSRDEAFHWLEIAIDRHEDAAIVLLTSPAYASLRGDARYASLLQRVGLSGAAQ
jgi:DNA-binding winged helix-turn-helix (wHTH) protein/tetratricopeptide (TPR) repeat protein/TolB-like protein